MCSNWFLGGWMFVCCIWDEAWILNEVDCNLSFCLDLKVFFLNEVSSFLLFLCNDLISQLHRRGTILFSQIVMVKEGICKDRMRSSKQSSMSPCPHLLISLSPMAALIRNNFLLPEKSHVLSSCVNKSSVCLSSVSPAWDHVFCRAFTIKFCCLSNDTLKLPYLISLFIQALVLGVASGYRFPLDITCVGCNCELFRLAANQLEKNLQTDP